MDLKVARLLLNLEEKYPSLQNVCFYKAVDVERTLAILVGHGDVPKSSKLLAMKPEKMFGYLNMVSMIVSFLKISSYPIVS